MAICEKCGKEFEAKGEWQKVCIDCYKAGATAKKTTSSKGSGVSAEVDNSTKAMKAEDFRKKYDEVVAAFSDILPDVQAYIGGWVTSLVLDSHKAKK